MKQGVKKGKKAREAYAKAKKDFVSGCRDIGIIVGKNTVLPTYHFRFSTLWKLQMCINLAHFFKAIFMRFVEKKLQNNFTNFFQRK